MKKLLISFAIFCLAFASYAGTRGHANNFAALAMPDTVALQLNGNRAYYRKVVKLDSSIKESAIYARTIQFMAAKNIQLNYGYEQEGKMIFFTNQDLNINEVYFGYDDSDMPDNYTAQFALEIDIKNGRYRYTVHDIIFFYNNKRMPLDDVYLVATNAPSKRVARDAKKMIDSFERYINGLTTELHEDIAQKALVYNYNF